MSGVSFKDFQLPYWPEVLDACKAIGGLIPLMRLQHIDFAFTDQGLKILEINDIGGTEIAQLHGHGLLTERMCGFSKSMAIEPVTHGLMRFN